MNKYLRVVNFLGALIFVTSWLFCRVPVVEAESTKAEAAKVEKVVKSKTESNKSKPYIAPKKKAEKQAKAKSTKPIKSAKKSTKKPVSTVKNTTQVKRKGETGPLNEFELGKYQYCGDDTDCISAENGCCDCANGGQDVAVNKERFKDFRDRFECLHVTCGEKVNYPPCGSGVVSCLNHKCVYIPDNALEDKF